MKPSHHRSGGFRNSNPDIVIGNFPWYEMVWRGLRGDFTPLAKPEGGYDGFARDWSMPHELPPNDLVLVSHNHYDHLCDATIAGLIAAGQQPSILVPLGLKAWFDARDIGPVTELDWWDSVDVPTRVAGAHLRIHFTPSQHWSRNGIAGAPNPGASCSRATPAIRGTSSASANAWDRWISWRCRSVRICRVTS